MADNTSTATAPVTYLERISIGKEAKAAQELVEAAQDGLDQLNLDISAAKKEKRKAQQEVEAACAAIPFNSADVLEANRAVTETAEDLAQLLDLKERLFGSIAE